MPGSVLGKPPPISPAQAGLLNDNQAQFVAELTQKTGLSGGVVAAWVLSEEPKSAGHAPNGANNWLNIGATGSGNFAGSNPAWTDPVKAADLTAQWLQGQAIPGFGAASAGIRSILQTAGQPAAAQITAIQHSGWAASGYPQLSKLYNDVVNSPGTLGQVGNAVSSAVGSVTGAVSSVGDLIGMVTSTAFWIRVGEAVLGILALYLGLHALTGQSASGGEQAAHIKKVFIPV
jgi:hypothetical protein